MSRTLVSDASVSADSVNLALGTPNDQSLHSPIELRKNYKPLIKTGIPKGQDRAGTE